MKAIMFILFALVSTTLFSTESDQQFAEDIVGVWWNRISNGHISSESTEDFRKDGTLITKGDVYANGKLVEQYTFKSTWKIEGGYSKVEVVESSNPNVLPVGLKITDKIVSLNEKEFVYESEDGKQHTLTRLEK